jgi:hypothetical protein
VNKVQRKFLRSNHSSKEKTTRKGYVGGAFVNNTDMFHCFEPGCGWTQKASKKEAIVAHKRTHKSSFVGHIFNQELPLQVLGSMKLTQKELQQKVSS